MARRPSKPIGADAGSRDGWEAWRNVLALRRLGFTLDEMRHMTMADFIAYADLAYNETENEPEVRDATQADIDRLLG